MSNRAAVLQCVLAMTVSCFAALPTYTVRRSLQRRPAEHLEQSLMMMEVGGVAHTQARAHGHRLGMSAAQYDADVAKLTPQARWVGGSPK